MAVIDQSFLQGSGDRFKQSTNSILRQNAFSLEYYEVFYDLSAAQDYAKNNPLAYVGQKISVVGESDTVAYLITDTAGSLKEISGHTQDLNANVVSDTDKLLAVTESGKLYGTIALKWSGQDLILVGKEGQTIGAVQIQTYPIRADYDTMTEELVLVWLQNDPESGEQVEVPVRIPLGELVFEWTTEDTDTIELKRDRITDGRDILRGIVKLYTPETSDTPNAIQVKPGEGLFVPDLAAGSSDEFSSLLKVEGVIKDIQKNWTVKTAATSNSLELKVTENGVLSGDVCVDSKTIITGNSGLEANIDGVSLVYDETKKQLTIGRIDGGEFI